MHERVFGILLIVALVCAKSKWEWLNEHQDKIILPQDFTPQIREGAPLPDPNKFQQRQDSIVVHENVLPVVGFLFVNETCVFALLASNYVMRSVDGMMNWNQVVIQTYGTSITQLTRVPSDPSMFYFAGSGNYSWISLDYGNTFNVIFMNTGPISGVQFHPSQRATAVGYHNPSKTVYLSQNFGKTWSPLRSSVYAYSWCGNNLCVIADVDTNEASGGGPKRFVVIDIDHQQQIKLPVPLFAYNFVIHPKFIFLMAEDMEGADLFISSDNGTTFNRAQLPPGLDIPYFAPEQLLDDRTGAVWIAINHNPHDRLRSGNVYVSDTDGYRFTLQLEDVVSVNNWWDFDVVASLDGTYLANVLDNFGNPDPNQNTELEFDAKTLITFDNGNEWERLPPPATTNCTALGLSSRKCYLNLFGVTTWLGIGGSGYFGNFYSAPEAVGLILATGNVGEYLRTDADAVVTYMSRDGGLSWIELMKGSTVYEFADHGGVLVLVHNQVPTTTLFYSLDEGLSWNSLEFAKSPMIVVNVWNLAANQKKVTIVGRYVYGSTVYYGIDFTNVQERECVITDYEEWTTRDADGQNCVLGHSTVYRRRKRDSQCFNDEALNHIVSRTNCNCTEDDYECDFNFEKTQLSGKCVRVADTPIVCNEQNQYPDSQGYRKLQGDTCINDLPSKIPVFKKCPSGGGDNEYHPGYVATSSGLGKVTVALIVLSVIGFVIALIAVGIVIGAKSERLKTMVPWLNKVNPGSNFSTQLPMEDDIE